MASSTNTPLPSRRRPPRPSAATRPRTTSPTTTARTSSSTRQTTTATFLAQSWSTSSLESVSCLSLPLSLFLPRADPPEPPPRSSTASATAPTPTCTTQRTSSSRRTEAEQATTHVSLSRSLVHAWLTAPSTCSQFAKGHAAGDAVWNDIAEMLEREAEGSDSLEVLPLLP